MRMKSLILIFIALGCGLVASIGISQVMDRGGGGGNVEMEQILVALADIDIGSKLDAQNVKLEDWPKAKVPEGAVRRLEDVKEKFANSRFFKGEPIHTSRITDNLKSVANAVPEGFRAMPVKVDEDTVMKAISPGDRVDVMVFLRKNEEIQDTGVFTILKNVRVFAVNTNTERNSEGGGKNETANFRTVSLLVTPDQSRDLAVAAQIGKILLTLRRPDEQDDKTGEEATNINMLLGGHPKLASDPLKQGSTIPQFSTPKHTPAGSANPPEFYMELWTPNNMERFDWYDVKQLPQKAGSGPGGSTAPPSEHQTAPPAGEGEPAEGAAPAEGEPTTSARAAGSRRY